MSLIEDFSNVAVEFTVDGPVTFCPPGKRSKEIQLREKAGTIPVSTATALQWPAPEAPKRRIVASSAAEADKLVKAAERQAAIATVVAQPHRRGSDDPRLAFPLWRFCLRAWPNDPDFREAMYKTGVSYETEVRLVQVAYGFHVAGGKDDDAAHGESEADEMTPEEIEAARAARDGLERTLERSNDVVRVLHPRRAVSALVSLCFDHQEPLMANEAMLKDALALLSFHYGHQQRPIYAQYRA